MSMGPALLSRRSLLRGAASVTVLAALAAVSSCSDGPMRAADGAGESVGSALLRLGHTIADQPGDSTGSTGSTGSNGSTAPMTRPDAITSDGAAVRAIAERDGAVRADFTAGRTVGAAGWLLSATEVDVLVAYAGACPMPAC